jgi:hypothetical protein
MNIVAKDNSVSNLLHGVQVALFQREDQGSPLVHVHFETFQTHKQYKGSHYFAIDVRGSDLLVRLPTK